MRTVLEQVRWNFVLHDPFHDEVAFVAALREYNEQFTRSYEFDPDAVAVDAPAVTIQYSYYEEDDDEDDQLEATVDLEADNGRFFRQAELLFKTHKAISARLAYQDQTFFEGFEPWLGENPNRPGVPLYFVSLGS